MLHPGLARDTPVHPPAHFKDSSIPRFARQTQYPRQNPFQHGWWLLRPGGGRGRVRAPGAQPYGQSHRGRGTSRKRGVRDRPPLGSREQRRARNPRLGYGERAAPQWLRLRSLWSMSSPRSFHQQHQDPSAFLLLARFLFKWKYTPLAALATQPRKPIMKSCPSTHRQRASQPKAASGSRKLSQNLRAFMLGQGRGPLDGTCASRRGHGCKRRSTSDRGCPLGAMAVAFHSTDRPHRK